MSNKVFLGILWFVVLLPSLVHSEPRPPRAGPKIGLALAGGGARGLAHLGVLKWFEEHRIPVDYIGGTSMGALVAGLYATGKSSAEMMEFVNGIDWVDVLRGSPAYQELSFRRKEDQRAYPNDVELGFQQGIRLPSALNSGHKVGLLLDRLAFPYSNLKSFDDLPTPFRCVAVDLVQMNPFIFKEGSFSQALRATMSIPGVFAPVKDGHRVLVDGGLLNNLPTDVVKEMGSDKVIAVDLRAPEPEELDVESFLGVLNRSIDVMIQANVRRNIELADVVLQPNLKGYGSFSFTSQHEIIDRGYQAAEQQAHLLLALALNEPAWESYLQNRHERRRVWQSEPLFVTTQGVLAQDQKSVENLLKGDVGRPLGFQTLEAKLTKITGWGRYDEAGYTKEQKGGREGLGVGVHSKSYGPPFVKPSIEVNGADIGDVRFTLAARLTFYDVLKTKSEWRNDFSFGFRNLAATEFYQPLGKSGFFAVPRAFASRRTQIIYFNENRLGDYVITDQAFGLDLGYTTGSSHEFRMGYQLGHEKGQTRIGDTRIPTYKGRAASFSASWQFDRLDDPVIPTHGVRVKTQGWWFLSSPGALYQFPQAEINLVIARPVKQGLSTFFVTRGGSTFGKEASPLQYFTLGGPLQLGALGLQERRGNHYFYSSLGLIKLLPQSPGSLIEKISVTAYYEIGDAFFSKANPFNDVAAGLLGKTKIGVLFLGGSVGESGRAKVYFSFGRFF